MATDHDDADIPASGGVFTFGKSRFADNLPNKFWIRNDEVIHAACGDEHTVLVAGSGRVFVFGDNSYGQLGLGNTKPQTKPTCIKSLKGERALIVGCGKSHTLVATDSGKLYGFGHNNDGQCGVESSSSCLSPEAAELDKNVNFKKLDGGSSHSVGLTDRGDVYVWGDNSEGQLGIGSDVDSCDEPTKLQMKEEVKDIACGYYHTALITSSGKLYTFGESDSGKLGLGDGVDADTPTRVELSGKACSVSCGGNHTSIVTTAGRVYTFGNGQNGQLGQGTNTLDCSTPAPITSIKDLKIAKTTCGENFTTVVSAKGQLLTFGDGRHGKLALGAENFTNQFRPFRVPRFTKFEVTSVQCGGCHMIVLARKKDAQDSEEEIMDPLNSTFANSLRLSTDADLGASARDRRRAVRETPEPLSRTLPPLASKGLPPLNSTLPAKLKPLRSTNGLPQTLDKRKLPEAHFGQGDEEESDSEVSVTPEGSSEEDEEEQTSFKNKRDSMKKQSDRIATAKQRVIPPRGKKKIEEESEEESEEEFHSKAKGKGKQVIDKKKSRSKYDDSEEESEEEEKKQDLKKGKKMRDDDDDDEDSEEDSEEERFKKKKKKKPVADSEDEESEEEKPKKKTTPGKKSLSLFGKKNKKIIISDDEDDDDDEEEKVTSKNKKNSRAKSKKIMDSEDDDDDEEDEEEDEKKKIKDTSKVEEKSAAAPEKKSRACSIL